MDNDDDGDGIPDDQDNDDGDGIPDADEGKSRFSQINGNQNGCFRLDSIILKMKL